MKDLVRFACVAVLGVSLAGCALWGQEPDKEEEAPKKSGPVQPIDAFEQVEEPRREYPGREDPDGLSRDIERLQDAKRKYEHDRAVEEAERRRQQEECKSREDAREVPIEDGSEEPAEYCQPPASEESED